MSEIEAETDAEFLHRAAAAMRERARAVMKIHSGRWETAEIDPIGQAEHRALGQYSAVHDGSKIVCPVPGFQFERKPLAEYIASWDPVMAVAVADLLDSFADLHWVRDHSMWSYAHRTDELGRHYEGSAYCTEECVEESQICNGCGSQECSETPRMIKMAETYLGRNDE